MLQMFGVFVCVCECMLAVAKGLWLAGITIAHCRDNVGWVCACISHSVLFLPCRDEEGGEHLRKRSMHLPFTFATGEALLYQSSHSLPGFPDLFQSKGKHSKSKKPSCSRVGRSEKNGIDPRSLLGAVMQQDKAVYTSHPDPAQNPSFSSTSQFGGVSLPGAGGDAWSVGTAPVSSRDNSLQEKLLDLQQENPLLATMDSLTIKSDESCSNSLFSALEGLGLNAEELELLLLDEKMLMVSMDPDQSPSLNNSLASDQILSYVPSHPVDEHEGGQQVCPLPGTPPSPQGGTAPCHTEGKDSRCHLAQHAGQPSTEPPIPLWEQPLSAVPGLLPELAEQEELSSGSQWGPAGEETLLHFLQPVQGTPWDRAPSSAPGAPCLQEPPGAQQLQGDFPAVQPFQEDAQQSFSLPSQCQNRVAVPSQRKHSHLLMNGVCGTSPSSSPHPSPWQDYVCPLLGSPAQPDIYGLSQDTISQPQGCLGPRLGMPPQHFNLNRLCSMEAAGTGDSWEEMAPYPRCFSPSYQLTPKKQLSPVPCVPQQSFPSSAAGHFGSIGSPLKTLNSYGGHASALSQEDRHRVRALLSFWGSVFSVLITFCKVPHHCSLSLPAPQRFAQLSHGTAPRPPSAGEKPGTALPASAARSPSCLQGGLLSLGETGMDKAELLPGEGATFKLQITNLPHCCAQSAGAMVALAHLGVFALSLTSHHPAPCAVLVLVSLAWGGTAAELEDRFPRALEQAELWLQVSP